MTLNDEIHKQQSAITEAQLKFNASMLRRLRRLDRSLTVASIAVCIQGVAIIILGLHQ